jgi:hypothetical protein
MDYSLSLTFEIGLFQRAKDGFIMADLAFALQRGEIRPAIEKPARAMIERLASG